MNDWTGAWTRAVALALSASLRRPLSSAASLDLLHACMLDLARRERLPLIAHVVLPSGLHVIGWQGSPLPWTDAVGRVKQAFTHRAHGLRLVPPGSPWRLEVRVRPLADRDLPGALEALAAMPERAGLRAEAGAWPWSSRCQPARTGVASG